MQRRLLFINLTLLAALIALAMWQTSSGIGNPQAASSESSDTVEAVRGYYTDLEQFLATGDANLLAEYADGSLNASFAPAAGLVSGDSAFLETALAMRSTCPGMTVDVLDLAAVDDQAAAQVSVQPATDAVTAANGCDGWMSRDFFQLADGKLTELTASKPDIVLQHDLAWLQAVETYATANTELMAGRVSFWNTGEYVAVPGPGLLIINEGSLVVAGNNLIQVASLVDGGPELLQPLADVSVAAGQIVVIPRGQAVVRNLSGAVTHATMITSIPTSWNDCTQMISHDCEEGGAIAPLARAMLESGGAQVSYGEGMVETLTRAAQETPSGKGSLHVQWAVIPMGEAMPLPPQSTAPAIAVISGEIAKTGNSAAGSLELVNTGGSPALVLLAAFEAAA